MKTEWGKAFFDFDQKNCKYSVGMLEFHLRKESVLLPCVHGTMMVYS